MHEILNGCVLSRDVKKKVVRLGLMTTNLTLKVPPDVLASVPHELPMSFQARHKNKSCYACPKDYRGLYHTITNHTKHCFLL